MKNFIHYNADVDVIDALYWSVVHPCCLWWSFCVLVENSSSLSVKVATNSCSTANVTLGLKSPAYATESPGLEPPPSSTVEGLAVAAGNWGWLLGFEGPERNLYKVPLGRFLSSYSFFFVLCCIRKHTKKLLAYMLLLLLLLIYNNVVCSVGGGAHYLIPLAKVGQWYRTPIVTSCYRSYLNGIYNVCDRCYSPLCLAPLVARRP